MASIFPTGLTYSRNTKDPLQSKIVWNSLAEASGYVNNPDETAYIGMTLAVTNDPVTKNNEITYYELGDYFYPEFLKELKSAKKYIFME